MIFRCHRALQKFTLTLTQLEYSTQGGYRMSAIFTKNFDEPGLELKNEATKGGGWTSLAVQAATVLCFALVFALWPAVPQSREHNLSASQFSPDGRVFLDRVRQ
jgi:hypothetical protein